MDTLSLYLLKTVAISGLLTAWYVVGLRGRRLHQYNRVFLLSVLAFSLTIPLLHFGVAQLPRAFSGGLAAVSLPDQPAAGQPGVTGSSVQISQLPWAVIAGIIISVVSLALLAIVILRIIRIWSMRRNSTNIVFKGVHVVLTDAPGAPFTFLNSVFWNRALPLHDEVGQLIFRHESTHVRQRHTYDKLACQLLTCVFWFNPFYWIIQRELGLVHEFIADEHAVTDRDTEVFAMMLLRSYSNGSYLSPEHHFFASPVKRRLAMLQGARRPSFALFRQFLAIPVTAAAILLFSRSAGNAGPANIVPAGKKIILLLDAAHGGADAGAQHEGYTEKDICLAYARRIKELAPAYNVEVKLTRENDLAMRLPERIALAGSTHPDVFVSLHVGEQRPAASEKGDFEIYVSGKNIQAEKSKRYSAAIFGVLAAGGIIPGGPPARGHTHSPGCRCHNCQPAADEKRRLLAAEKDGIYVLKNVQAPGLVVAIGDIHNTESMRQLTERKRQDAICHAILQGIVQGSSTEEALPRPLDILSGTSQDGKCR